MNDQGKFIDENSKKKKHLLFSNFSFYKSLLSEMLTIPQFFQTECVVETTNEVLCYF